MNAHNGAWQLMVEGEWGQARLRQYHVEKMVATYSLNESVRQTLQGKLYQAYQMLNTIERAEAGNMSPPDEFKFYLEPINNRLFEVRLFSKLLLAERATAVDMSPITRTRYIGMDVYCRRDTGILHGHGLLDDRYDEVGIQTILTPA